MFVYFLQVSLKRLFCVALRLCKRFISKAKIFCFSSFTFGKSTIIK